MIPRPSPFPPAILLAAFFAFLAFASSSRGEDSAPAAPSIPSEFAGIASRLGPGVTILRPDRAEPEWWAGAPSVARGPDGVFWMACRMRDAVSPRGLRGYEIRILRSDDGVRFEKVRSIHRDEVPIPGFERPCLLFDAEAGLFDLYACGPWKGGPWSILRFDSAASPADFDPTTARPVISPIPPRDERDVVPVEYKDPVIVHAGGRRHAWVIGYMRRNERIYHFESDDGETWRPVGDPRESAMELSGWHDFFVRPASVLALGFGWLFVYEGSRTTWRDPVYNVGTGLAFTFDLHRVRDLTPDAPFLLSDTPADGFATFRYSHWMRVDDELRIYAEVSAPDGTHEIRLYRTPMSAP